LKKSSKDSYLNLDQLSTYKGKKLLRISDREFKSYNDGCWRYAVSSTALSSDRCSYWAVDIIQRGMVIVGLTNDNSLEVREGTTHWETKGCWMWRTGHLYVSSLLENTHTCFDSTAESRNDEMSASPGAAMLFSFDPLRCRLAIMNSMSRKSITTDNVQQRAGLYIHVDLYSYTYTSARLAHVRLRELTPTEQDMIKSL
jgi:hypothetical protein